MIQLDVIFSELSIIFEYDPLCSSIIFKAEMLRYVDLAGFEVSFLQGLRQMVRDLRHLRAIIDGLCGRGAICIFDRIAAG